MSKKAIEVVCDNRKKFVDKIIERLEKGHGIWEKDWKTTDLSPQNPVSGVKYKGINRFMLAFESIEKGYDDPRWITMKHAKENGYKLKEGEEGVICEKWLWEKQIPVIDEETGEQKIDSNGKKVFTIEELTSPYCNYFKLYNAKQFENFPELERPNLMEKWSDMELIDFADRFISSSECPITEINKNINAYLPRTDEIYLVPREQFKSAESFLGTVLHEMSHSTGHEKRLNRELTVFKDSKNEKSDKEKYAMEELVAELSTTFIEADLGINLDFQSEDHLAYMGSWIDILKKEPNILYKVCKSANMSSELIMDNYNLELEKNRDYMEDQAI